MKLYHFKPPQVVGDSLIPLSELQERDSTAYDVASRKYRGREHVPQNFIPLLDCNWEDVIFLSPIHPQVLHGVLRSCGCDGLVGAAAYVIDSDKLKPARLVTYEYARGGEYRYYEPDAHLRYARISETTREAYRNAVRAKKRPFLFAGVTHVLYHGEIPIAGLPEVQVMK